MVLSAHVAAQALLANIAAMYAVYHGPDGLNKIAQRVNGLAAVLAAGVPRLILDVQSTSCALRTREARGSVSFRQPPWRAALSTPG